MLVVDHLRETEPVNMDQKASRIIADKTQNLYPLLLLPNKPEAEAEDDDELSLSLFEVTVVIVVVAVAGDGVEEEYSFIWMN